MSRSLMRISYSPRHRPARHSPKGHLSFCLCPLSFSAGTTIVIPPRPFLHPTMEKYSDQVADNYRKTIRDALNWG